MRALVMTTMMMLAMIATSHADEKHKAMPFGEAAHASRNTRVVNITLKDNFFEPEAVSVRAGETVRFVITNKGDFLHEFALGRPEDHAEHSAMMEMMLKHGMITPTAINQEMMKMDHSKMGMPAHDHGPQTGSVLVEPGKTAEITWKFTRAMNVEFACTVPGHYEAGMVGKINFTR